MLLIPLLLALISAASLSSDPSAIVHFVRNLEQTNSIQQNPLENFLVPAWLQHLNQAQPADILLVDANLDDAAFSKDLEFLRNAECDPVLHSFLPTELVKEHLALMASKIVSTVRYAQTNIMSQESDYWFVGLKEHARTLVKNTKAVFSPFETVGTTVAKAPSRQTSLNACVLLGLMGDYQRNEMPLLKSEVQSPDLAILQASDSTVGASLAAWRLRHFIQASEQVEPSGGQMTGLLSLLGSLTTLEVIRYSGDIWNVVDLIERIPKGFRFLLPVQSCLFGDALFHMIKAEDTYVYGVIYQKAGQIAFLVHHSEIKTFLVDQNWEKDLEKFMARLPSLSLQPVTLKWLSPAGDSFLSMLHAQVLAWGAGERIWLGALWDLYQKLSHGDKVEHLNRWLQSVSKLSPTNLQLLQRKIQSLPQGQLVAEISYRLATKSVTN